jgi:hypothetical protein
MRVTTEATLHNTMHNILQSVGLARFVSESVIALNNYSNISLQNILSHFKNLALPSVKRNINQQNGTATVQKELNRRAILGAKSKFLHPTSKHQPLLKDVGAAE